VKELSMGNYTLQPSHVHRHDDVEEVAALRFEDAGVESAQSVRAWPGPRREAQNVHQ
jgi:hypothetical protein